MDERPPRPHLVDPADGRSAALRGLSMVTGDNAVLALTGPVLDGLYEFFHHALMTGTEPG